ncbi:MAG: NIL domain-containing protein [Dehalococcoidia bacterium]
MATKRVRLSFEPNLVKEPVIYQLGQQFDLVTNIRMADVDENIGWVILQIDGESAEIDRGLDWARSLGVRVDPLAGDIVEGD